MAEPPPKRAIDQVIHDDLEPGVINEKMIKDTILAEYKGELGRMKTMERIELDKITVLRLEFLKILRIDHLWMLTSLKLLSLAFNRIDKIEKLDELTQLNELNISYNYIEVIENLEKLQNLKSLSLFGNRIKMVENIEELTSLKILSLGNNKIESLDGVKRLRFLKNLRCLNLEGNPIAKEDEGGRSFRSYISVFVPQLKYYAYVHISEEERETAFKVFRYDLHELEETEAAEVAARAKKENDLADEIQLSDSFVEFLNGHQLFDSFFEGEEDARALMSIGEEAVPMYNTFKEETYILTQKIYKNGLEQYDKRQKEIEMFEECVKLAREKVQEEGKKIITTFLEKYPPIKEEAVRVLQNMETEMFYSPDQLTQEYNKNFQRYEEILNEFDILVDLTWKSLMQKEIQLFEAVEDANANFEHNMQDMINEFIEAAQTQFVLMRDHQTLFTESLTEAAQFFISLRAASGETADVPPELRDSLEDRDIITNLSEGMKTVQMVRIDAREDRLAKRSREWCKNLALKYQEEEIQRNRAKVNEISYFLENYKFEFSNLQENIKGEDITKA